VSLTDREAVESAAREADEARNQALELLRDAVRGIGDPVTDDTAPEDLLKNIRAWRQAWKRQLDTAAEERDAWTELTTLLAGATLPSLDKDLGALRDKDKALRAAVHDAVVAAAEAKKLCREQAIVASVSTDAASITTALDLAQEKCTSALTEAAELATDADQAEGALVERTRTLPDVTEAEETLATARLAHTDVVRLGKTLDLTKSYLSRAQEAAHRDIAPVLTRTLREWLPMITGGRYVDATLDPASLAVQVCGPVREWRDGAGLSVGTVEQVHLLLRIALVHHLTVAGESCPLLLDDVTVQADDVRTKAILDLLLALSEQRQIVLFSQESSVLGWAEQHLDGEQHTVRRLAPVTSV
jgi:hypothetical protein